MLIGFFEALFGSLYIGGRLLGDKMHDRTNSHMEAVYKKVESVCTNSAREHQVERENVLKLSTIQIAEKIPKDDIVYIFGRDYADLLTSYRAYIVRDEGASYRGFYDINSLLINVLLSQEGLVRSVRLFHGYRWSGLVQGLPIDRKNDICKRACKVIDRNIRRAHPEIDMYLCEDPADDKVYRWSAYLRSSGINRRPVFPDNK